MEPLATHRCLFFESLTRSSAATATSFFGRLFNAESANWAARLCLRWIGSFFMLLTGDALYTMHLLGRIHVGELGSCFGY
jgi:hypothetical protein